MARYIIKTSGQREPFSVKKLKRSLRKAGASKQVIDKIAQEILSAPELNTTKKIYDYAYTQLKGIERPLAARYSLKHALYGLGPSGYIFERFVGEVFKAQGYQVQIGAHIQGLCIDHEVDLLIEKKKKRSMVECKFHNRPGRKTDVKDALYTKARYDDLSAQWSQQDHSEHIRTGVWLVTNTQFTSKVIDYGLCAGITLLGWNYPKNKGIAALIDRYNLHPITSLTCITKAQKRRILQHNVLLCRDLLKRPDLLKILNFRQLEQRRVTDECKALCTLNS